MSAQYFAQLDDNDIVIAVHVVQRDFLEANPERYPGRWVETFLMLQAKLMLVKDTFMTKQHMTSRHHRRQNHNHEKKTF